MLSNSKKSKTIKNLNPKSELLIGKSIYTMYIHLNLVMVRRMKATITQIESVVTPSGNSGHVVVPRPRSEKKPLSD
jgi:hypothetical protein